MHKLGKTTVNAGGYYNVDGENARIKGLPARTPFKLKEHKLERRTISDLNRNRVSTIFSTAVDGGSSQESRISLTISLPANPGRVTSGEEQGFFNGIITGNENIR